MFYILYYFFTKNETFFHFYDLNLYLPLDLSSKSLLITVVQRSRATEIQRHRETKKEKKWKNIIQCNLRILWYDCIWLNSWFVNEQDKQIKIFYTKYI